ncbi:MAG: hypothetical protein ABEK16_03720 [Candidatus Nanohalobium sp.]
MAGVFGVLLQSMIDSRAYYVFIWLLFAALIYGLLAKYEIFSDESVMAGASLGSSLFTLLGIYAYELNEIFLNFAAAIGFGLFALFGTIILLAMGGVEPTDVIPDEEGEFGILALFAGLIVLIAFIGALIYNLDLISLLSINTGGDTWQNVIFPVVFLLFLLLMIDASTGGD